MEFDLHKSPLEPVLVISFAHYTVREFLGSDRLAMGPVAYFMLEQQIHLDIQRTILLNALEFGASDYEELCDEDDDDDKDDEEVGLIVSRIYHNLTNNFRSYCAVTAIFNISSHPSEIISRQALSEHVFDILRSSGPHAELILKFLGIGERYLALVSANGDRHELTPLDADFTSLVWKSVGSTSEALEDAMLLFSILLLMNKFEPLANGLFQITRQRLGFIHTPLRFTISVFFVSCSFDGRMIEFFSEICEFFIDRELRMRFLLDQDTTLPNPTAVLFAYLGRRPRDRFERRKSDPQLLNRLLKLGADPNGAGYTLTPLQLAAVGFDFVAVETLLRAEADPNRLGDPDSVRWSSMFYDHQVYEGLSPLFICQDESKRDDLKDERRALMIEALLLQYGAKSFASAGAVPSPEYDSRKQERNNQTSSDWDETMEGSLSDEAVGSAA
jgi:hypothetical protein